MKFMPAFRRDDDLDLFDDVFSAPFFDKEGLMKTDITEKDGRYNLAMDLPGFRKEDVKVSLYDGTLTIEASRNNNSEEKDRKGNVIRQERYAGSLRRSFYVGEEITEEDIKAKLAHGVLTLHIPKKEEKPKLPEKKTIAIEG